MNQERPLGLDTPALPGLRTFIVPPDIVAVPRRSPVPARKRTPWRPRPEATQAIDRTGGRDWFGDHLSSQAARPQRSRIYAGSLLANGAAAVVVSLLMAGRARVENPEPHQPLFVTVALALGSPVVPELEAPLAKTASQPAPTSAPAPKAEEPAVAIESAPAAPVDAPSSIQPESAAPPAGPAGTAIGVPDGGERSVAGSDGGSTGGVSGPPAAGPVRLGAGIQPPKKVKDVKAIYPAEALSGQLRGTVVIEATISVEGRVIDAVVKRSIPGLDQAALDAVRQWEYEPARANGSAVAVIMTVTVAFSIL